MLSKNHVISIIAISLIFAGCNAEATLPISSLTNDSTITATRTVAAGKNPPTRKPAINVTPDFLLEEDLLLTPGASPSLQTPIPPLTLAPPQGDSSNYRLTLADPESLIQIARELTFKDEYFSDAEFGSASRFAYEVIGYEWARAYSSEAYSSSFYNLLPIESGYDWVPNEIKTDVIGDYLVDYFNDEKVEFEHDEYNNLPDGAYGITYKTEIDNDGFPEWLILVRDEKRLGKGEFGLALNQNEDGSYTRMVNQLSYFYGFSRIEEPEFQIRDLNGDGVVDFAIEEIRCGFGTCIGIFHIIIGKPDGFHRIESTAGYGDNYASRNTYWSEAKWSISPDNNLPILEITWFRDLKPWDCIVFSKETYQWIGDTERVTTHPTTSPDTAICAIARAMDDEEAPDHKTQIQLLNYAYNHPDVLSEEWRVFVLYRLALLHALEREDWAARRYLDLLAKIAQTKATPIADSLSAKIEPLLSEKRLYPYKLCLAAEAISTLNAATDWNIFLGFLTYPYEGFSEGYPAPLCETRSIHLDALNALKVGPNQNLDELLLEVGVPLELAFSFDKSIIPSSWVIAFEDDDPNYYIRGKEKPDSVYVYGYSDELGWFELKEIPSLYDQLQINLQDITGDGVPDLSFASFDTGDESCENEITYNVDMITSQVKGMLLTYLGGHDDFVCVPQGQAIDFTQFLEDKNGDGYIDWVSNRLEQEYFDVSLLEELELGNSWIIHRLPFDGDLESLIDKSYIIRNIHSDFLTFDNPAELRDEIIFYRDRWGMDDVVGHYIRAHLDYLLALSYELQGNEDQAIEIYYRIWRDQSETIWAYMAASRLEYVL